MIDAFRSDIRSALARLIRQRRLSTLTIILTIALVTGAGTTVWAFLNATLVRALPYPDADRLAAVYTLPPHTTDITSRNPLPPIEFARFRNGLASVEAVEGAWSNDRIVASAGNNGEPISIAAARVTPGYLALLGGQTAIGRIWTEEEDAADAKVVVIGDSVWQRMFGRDSRVLGSTLIIDRIGYEIIGVLRPGFRPSAAKSELWTPTALNLTARPLPNATIFNTIVKLRRGAALSQLNAEAIARMAEVAAESPSTSKGTTAGAISLRDHEFGTTRGPIVMLLCAVLALAAIAMANLANLRLTRVIAERHEFALRLALGASRWSLVRMQIVEGTVLAFAGGALGALLASIAVPLCERIDPATFKSLGSVPIDWPVVMAALLMALVVSVLSGLWPVLRESGRDLAGTVAGGSRRATGSPKEARLRQRVVAVEAALALALLVLTGLFAAALARTARKDPGFDPDHLLAGQLRMPAQAYANNDARAAFVRSVLDRVRAIPGVVDASTTLNPFENGDSFVTVVEIEGRPSPDGTPYTVDFRRISGGYFQTMKIPMVSGRAIDGTDRSGSQLAAVVSRSMAARYWPNEDPIGKRVKRGQQFYAVVGVAADVHDIGPKASSNPTFYVSFQQNNTSATPATLVVRTTGAPGDLTRAVRAAVLSVDPSQPIEKMTTVTEALSSTLGADRLRGTLLAAFSVLGLVLTSVGIYGVTSGLVEERTREMGVRLVLGETPSGLRWLVIRQAASTVAIGGACGALIASALVRPLGAVVPGLSWTDAWAAVPGAAALILAAIVASWWPAERAARADPAVSLRT